MLLKRYRYLTFPPHLQASILQMTIGKSYWIFVDDNLEPEELVEFGINPRNANMLLFRSACDGDGKDVRKADELVGDLQRQVNNCFCFFFKSIFDRSLNIRDIICTHAQNSELKFRLLFLIH